MTPTPPFWTPARIAGPLPKAEALAEAIAEGARLGVLRAGQRLPSHRGLARQLGIAPGTVTAAYALAENRGLVVGEVGRGTFLRHVPPKAMRMLHARTAPGAVDLYQNYPLLDLEEERAAWSEAFDSLRASTDLPSLLRGGPDPRVGRVLGKWLQERGLRNGTRELLLTPSFQNSIAAILSSVARPGDRVAMTWLAHPVLGRIARQLSLVMEPIDLRHQGVNLRDLERALMRGVRIVILQPTLHTPTATTLDERRRRKLARLIERHDALLIELEAEALLTGAQYPPLAALAPDHTCLLVDLRYALSMGLSTHLLQVPPDLEAKVAAASLELGGLPPALQGEVASRWVESGVADHMARTRSQELAARNQLARSILGEEGLQGSTTGHHVWWKLPSGLRAETFVARAEERGVAVTEPSWFALQRRKVPDAVRICFGNVSDRERLRVALGVLRDCVNGNHVSE